MRNHRGMPGITRGEVLRDGGIVKMGMASKQLYVYDEFTTTSADGSGPKFMR